MLSLQKCHNQEDDDSDRAERHETKSSKLFAAIEKITSIARIENARGVDDDRGGIWKTGECHGLSRKLKGTILTDMV